MNSDRGMSYELRTFLVGLGVGGLFGGCFGGFVAWWFGGGIAGVPVILIFHAAFAGGAMGGWVMPTLVAGKQP